MLDKKVEKYMYLFEKEIIKILSTLSAEDSIYFLKILNEKLNY